MPRDQEDRAPLDDDAEAGSDSTEGLFGVPDIIRRFAALGLSGFFTTESALRKALGDTLPQDWVDFAADQSERTREELFDRVVSEFGRIIENLEFVELLEQLVEGRTIEIETKIRLGPRTTSAGESAQAVRDERTDRR